MSNAPESSKNNIAGFDSDNQDPFKVWNIKFTAFFEISKDKHTGPEAKDYNTQYSRVVPHHSTDCAITSLTSEIRRDPVNSGMYGHSQDYVIHYY